MKLTPTHLTLVLHLADFWWDADRKPFPSKAKLAERVGLSPRHIQRQMAELEKMGLVKRNERRSRFRGKLPNEYVLSGLVARLKELAIEFKAADEEAKKKRDAVARPGIRKRIAAPEGD